MAQLESDGSWDGFRDDWRNSSVVSSETSTPDVWSVWSQGLLQDLSCAESVESVFAIGTVLSISLRDAEGGGKKLKEYSKSISTDMSLGYTSNAAKGLQTKLSIGGDKFNVHSRVLGNVLYLMSSVTSKPDSLQEMEELLRSALV
jgi:dethiobiotin synthetase/adenosylmethionine--8-amino-7-oxononanoate aminotransferase